MRLTWDGRAKATTDGLRIEQGVLPTSPDSGEVAFNHICKRVDRA